jgi:hypothetical protein
MVMQRWQADIYRRPFRDDAGNVLWELLVCTDAGSPVIQVRCPQSQVSLEWLTAQIQTGLGEGQPTEIQVFRPQSLNLLRPACEPLGIAVQPTRYVPALKALLRQEQDVYASIAGYTGQPFDPLLVEKLPPTPIPDRLLGKTWRFGAIAASDLEPMMGDRPIPIKVMPEHRLPVHLKLASTTLIPGIVVEGGRQSMALARWVQDTHPVALNYIPGAPDGLILEAGLAERWVFLTFDDPTMRAAANLYGDRLQAAQGLHFLLIQPDESGMTYSGFWLLRDEG